MKIRHRHQALLSFLAIFFFFHTIPLPHSASALVFSKTDGPRNFGVLLNSNDYTIYRSGRLGKSGLSHLKKYLSEKNLPFPRTIIYMNSNGYSRRMPFFTLFALEEYELQEQYGYTFYHPFDYERRTYVDGKNPFNPQKSIDQRKYINDEAAKIFNFQEDNIPDGGIDNVIRVLELVLDKKNGPVLFHCSGGMHRAGMIAMILRYLQGGEWVKGTKRKVRVMPSMKTFELNPAQYEYALHNQWLFRPENLEFVEKFAQHEAFLRLQKTYGEDLKRAGGMMEENPPSSNSSDDPNNQEVLTIQVN